MEPIYLHKQSLGVVLLNLDRTGGLNWYISQSEFLIKPNVLLNRENAMGFVQTDQAGWVLNFHQNYFFRSTFLFLYYLKLDYW